MGHVFRARSSNDLSCPTGSYIKVTAEAKLAAKIGNLKSPETVLTRKSLLDQCVELPLLEGQRLKN